MVHPIQRGGRQAVPAAPAAVPVPVHHVPHAALLIDFDNVTLGIRSDLTKELKTLLNSDIIRGKVAVRRAYADWRRYPQYIVPLSERSIDLIFATAVGSTKKNATDIRLAIDAIELVFTRPEIGTYILLSGDSDFSSLVMKLKEYGKFVIGVGIRESASDFLIQNCDEYYAYSELAGLSKETDTTSAQRDPWELVGEAVAHMARHSDVMRSDRLKQVMQQLDPNFDERNVGFNRFSKFVSEAGTRGLLSVSKLDNGQYEVAPVTAGKASPVAAGTAPAEERGAEGARRGRVGRGRGRGREDRPAAAPTPIAEAPPPSLPPVDRLTLAGGFGLMNKALGELPNPVPSEALRARMAALHGREDPMLDADRFERLLRQANDAEIAEVRRVGEDAFEVSLSRIERARLGVENGGGRSHGQVPSAAARGAAPSPSEPADEPVAAGRSAMLRFRRGSRGPLRPQEIPLIGMVDIAPAPPAPAPVPAPAVEAALAKKAVGRAVRGAKAQAKPVKKAVAVVSEPVPAPTADPPKRAPRGRGRGKKA